MRFKKAFLLILPMVLLSSCRWFEQSGVHKAGNTAENIPKQEKKVSVTVLNDESVFPNGLMTRAAKLFSSQNSGITVDIKTAADDYERSLSDDFRENTPPDLFLMFEKSGVYNWESVLEPIDESFRDKLIGALPKVESDGNILAIPAVLDWSGIIASNEILRTVGVSPRDITDFTSLKAAVNKVSESSGKIQRRFESFRAATEFPAGADSFIDKFIFRPYKAGLSPSDIGSVCDLMVKNSYWGEKSENLNVISYSDYIENGLQKRAFAFGFIDRELYNRLFDSSSDLKKESFTILPYFTESGEDDGVFITSDVFWGINRYSDSDKQTAAQSFLKWLYTSESGCGLLAEYGMISCVKNAPVDKAYTVPYTIGSYSDGGEAVFAESGEADNGFIYAVRSFLAGKCEWSEIFK